MEEVTNHDLKIRKRKDFEADTTASLEIWDTLGQERHSSIVSSYYKNASGIMIVYDVTNMESFLNVKSWLIELEDHFFKFGDQTEETFILVGNKSDLDS